MGLYLLRWEEDDNLNLSWNLSQIVQNYVIFYACPSSDMLLWNNPKLYPSFLVKFKL